MTYSKEFAEIYVQFYEHARGRDYRAEVRDLLALLRQRKTDVTSLLDVACGPGNHLSVFSELLDRVEGIDLSKDMLAVAEEAFPELVLHQDDMRDFRLASRFDAVICLFSSIGHVRDQDELDATLRSFAHHLTPGGVVVVEPWWFADTFLDGYVATDAVRVGDRAIARVSHSRRVGDTSRVDVLYAVADPGNGIEHFVENFQMTLFDRAGYEKAFTRAGLSVEYLEGGFFGRGLFVGVAR
ncbi:class I SAM-dependent methyltransferase [Actinosynnema sp. CS-041913]|uniref:class I SAM-dependent methyltransferase n=1 Tax=Actinosynnema sp. CS-041913 TaxID=3239917 RepID=UPI003D8D5F81